MRSYCMPIAWRNTRRMSAVLAPMCTVDGKMTFTFTDASCLVPRKIRYGVFESGTTYCVPLWATGWLFSVMVPPQPSGKVVDQVTEVVCPWWIGLAPAVIVAFALRHGSSSGMQSGLLGGQFLSAAAAASSESESALQLQAASSEAPKTSDDRRRWRMAPHQQGVYLADRPYFQAFL